MILWFERHLLECARCVCVCGAVNKAHRSNMPRKHTYVCTLWSFLGAVLFSCWPCSCPRLACVISYPLRPTVLHAPHHRRGRCYGDLDTSTTSTTYTETSSRKMSSSTGKPRLKSRSSFLYLRTVRSSIPLRALSGPCTYADVFYPPV